MAGERVKLVVSERERLGSRESRRLRRRGLVPGVLYGRAEPRAICVAERELRRALSGAGGLHTILDVVVDGGDGGARPAVLKAHQEDPVKGGLIHVDLHEVRLDRPIHASVTVALVGDPVGVREGGVLSQVTREVNVEALPTKIPEHLELDVSHMGVADTLRVGDLPLPEDVVVLDDPDTVLATVTQPTRVEAPEEMVEEEEAVTGVPEGEQAPERGAEAPLEPGAEAGTGSQGEPGTAPG